MGRARAGSRVAVVLAIVMLASSIGLPAAWAAPPPNDNFADAQVLSGPLPITVSGTNVDATKEPGEPDHAGNSGGASVWYTWTPTESDTVSVDTCDSEIETLVGVYTGDSVATLTEQEIQVAGCGSVVIGIGVQRLFFTAVAGTTYRIAADSFEQGSITLTIASVEPPTCVVNGGQVTSFETVGTPGGDVIDCSNAQTSGIVTRIDGLGGDDVITGSGGDDLIDAGGGDDIVFGGAGDDAIAGGEGDDTIDGQTGDDDLDGGPGVDRITGDGGNDTVAGGEDSDGLLSGGTGDDVLIGADDDDPEILYCDEDFDAALISAGDDPIDCEYPTDSFIEGGGQQGLCNGRPADDAFDFSSAPGPVTVVGTPGDDNIIGSAFGDTIDGRGGNDVICGQGGDDTVSGGTGDDVIIGDAGDDTLDGGPGVDTVLGGAGNDTVRGGLGVDILHGGVGDDLVDGADDGVSRPLQAAIGVRRPNQERVYGDGGTDTCRISAGDFADSASCEAGPIEPPGGGDGQGDDDDNDDDRRPGRITIIEAFRPDRDVTIGFHTKNLKQKTFRLEDDGKRVFKNLKAGTYTVAQDKKDGWRLDRIVCQDPTKNTKVRVDTRRAVIRLRAGEHVTCTFTNKKK